MKASPKKQKAENAGDLPRINAEARGSGKQNLNTEIKALSPLIHSGLRAGISLVRASPLVTFVVKVLVFYPRSSA
jgi:hypothetical protein